MVFSNGTKNNRSFINLYMCRARSHRNSMQNQITGPLLLPFVLVVASLWKVLCCVAFSSSPSPLQHVLMKSTIWNRRKPIRVGQRRIIKNWLLDTFTLWEPALLRILNECFPLVNGWISISLVLHLCIHVFVLCLSVQCDACIDDTRNKYES